MQKERKRLKDEEIAERIKEAERYVGMCFVGGVEYAKVIGGPGQLWSDFFHSYVNASEMTALIIDMDDDVPFAFDTINLKNPIWKEISQEEFNAVFEKAVARLRARAGVND